MYSADAYGQVCANPKAMQIRPTFSRSDLGAALEIFDSTLRLNQTTLK